MTIFIDKFAYEKFSIIFFQQERGYENMQIDAKIRNMTHWFQCNFRTYAFDIDPRFQKLIEFVFYIFETTGFGGFRFSRSSQLTLSFRFRVRFVCADFLVIY